jgi:hypothetical protein
MKKENNGKEAYEKAEEKMEKKREKEGEKARLHKKVKKVGIKGLV